MPIILNIYKPKGLTPLQTINLLRKNMPEYEKETIGFAGRLDPLAHGVLLLMIGEETTKQREQYLTLSKEYEFEVVFGVSTDTYDVLGLINNETMKSKMPRGIQSNKNLKNEIEEFIKSKLGKQLQTYPPYSSKPVNGKPLYKWAREDKLHEITIPTREIEIYNFQLMNIQTISLTKLESDILKQINSVDGDFRQKEIEEKWRMFFEENYDQILTTARFKIFCSSGTYIRSLVNELGKKMGTEVIALEILRTKVGDYSLSSSLKLL